MTVEELNAINAEGEMDEFIRVCEARQVKALTRIADGICARDGVRLVLLAGGSSAGKTTTAKRLATQLRVNGRRVQLLSTDDYFVGDARNPRDENGDFDYEHIECVDMPRLAADINALLSGASVHPRRFDFTRHDGYDAETEISLPAGGIILLEGIHALNPRLTEDVDDAVKFRVYIEPKPKIEVFVRTRLGATESRLLRRFVRDNQFRATGPEKTWAMWPKVLAGEKKWIEPFRGEADMVFDSSLDYELAVLRPYAEGLLHRLLLKVPDAQLVRGLVDLLQMVEPVSPVAVPGDSILRETIGCSQLTY